MRRPLVSGRARIKNNVSATSRTKVMAAGTTYTLRSRPKVFMEAGRGREAKYAPIGGPIQKHIAKAIPTWASALDRSAGVVTSDKIALASGEKKMSEVIF